MANWISPATYHSSCGDTNGWNASRFIDGNTGTFWYHEDTHAHWVILDLGKSYLVSRLRLWLSDYEGGRWDSFDVYVSKDYSDFGDPVGENLSVQTPESWNTVDVEDKVGRYIKLSGIDTAASYNVLFGYEIEVEVTDVGGAVDEHQVQASGDDWYENQAGGKTNSSSWVQTYYKTTEDYPLDAAFRFTGVTIPAGVTIDEATLKVYANYSTRDRADFNIYAELNDDAPDLTGPALNSRSYTTATVSWVSNLGTGWKTIRIDAIIQELVDELGGLDNANILIFFDSHWTGASDGLRMTPAVSDNAAKLEIAYVGEQQGGGPQPYGFIM
jgi:hypothetical protein